MLPLDNWNDSVCLCVSSFVDKKKKIRVHDPTFSFRLLFSVPSMNWSMWFFYLFTLCGFVCS